LFKRISSSTETEYSEKLLDLTELVLARLNKKIAEMTSDELKLCTICISIVSDLLEVNQILEHQMTTTIMSKKYPHLFRSLEEIMTKQNCSKYYQPLIKEYCRYKGACRCELDELEVGEKIYDVGRMYVQLQ